MATPKKMPFELVGADGGPLRGEVRAADTQSPRPAVVICHGFKGFKDWGFFPRLAERIALAGFNAVSFNFTGSGVGADGQSFDEPERFGHATFHGDLQDIARVCDALRSGDLGVKPPPQLGLFGHSRGGGTAILHAAASRQVDALVTWAAIGSIRRWSAEARARWRAEGKLDIVNARTGEVLPVYTDVLDEIEREPLDPRLDIRGAAARISAPWLIVHGDADEAVTVQDAHRLYEASNVNNSSELRILEGAGHTLGARHPWAGFTPELQRGFDATVDWFVRHVD